MRLPITVRTPEGEVVAPVFRKLSILPAKWQASHDIDSRHVVAYGKNKEEAAKNLQTTLDSINPPPACLVRTCTACGQPVPRDAGRCGNCGAVKEKAG